MNQEGFNEILDIKSERTKLEISERPSFFKQFKFLIQKKTAFCRHGEGCIENCVKGLFKSFYFGFLIRYFINLIVFLILSKKKRSLLLFIMVLFQKSNFQFASFLGIYSFLNKMILCTMRILTKSDNGFNSFLSGFIGGLCCFPFQSKNNRYMWRSFLWTRAFDIIYRNMVNKGIIKDRLINWGLIFGTFNTIIGYTFLHEPELLPKDVTKLWFKFANLHKNDLIWRTALIGWKRNILVQSGII